MTFKFQVAARAAAVALAFGASLAQAESVTLTPGHRVVVEFELPAQPAAHNSIWVTPQSLSQFGTLLTESAIFDSQGLVAKAASQEHQFMFFSAPDSYFIQNHDSYPWSIPFDFSRFAAGGSGYRFELTVLGSSAGGWMQFDTDKFLVYTFGDAGGYPAYYGKVTGVSVSAVPEPASLAMLVAGLGLLGLAARRRSRA